MIRAGVQANPWGLQAQSFRPFLLAYPGNSVAALAAYWVTSTDPRYAQGPAYPFPSICWP